MLESAVYVGLIPAALAAALVIVLRHVARHDVAARYADALAFAAAVLAGYLLLPDTPSPVPAESWEWIPYLGLAAASLGGMTLAQGVTRVERFVMQVSVAVVAAYLIVPRWPDLEPTRWKLVGTLAIGLAVLISGLERVASTASAWGMVGALTLTACACAVLVTSEVSESLGHLAGLPASALIGMAVAMAWRGPGNPRPVIWPWAIVVGGFAFIGYLYPSPPLIPLLVVPAAPLALGAARWIPAARGDGVRAVLIQLACVLVPLVVIATWLLVRGSGGEEW